MDNHISLLDDLLVKSTNVLKTKQNYEWVRQMNLTPSRNILLEPILLQSNRVIRHFSPSDFMIVRLLDEDLNRFDSGEVAILNHLKKLMSNGVNLPIDNGNFRLVGFSNSQSRQRHEWFTRLPINKIH